MLEKGPVLPLKVVGSPQVSLGVPLSGNLLTSIGKRAPLRLSSKGTKIQTVFLWQTISLISQLYFQTYQAPFPKKRGSHSLFKKTKLSLTSPPHHPCSLDDDNIHVITDANWHFSKVPGEIIAMATPPSRKSQASMAAKPATVLYKQLPQTSWTTTKLNNVNRSLSTQGPFLPFKCRNVLSSRCVIFGMDSIFLFIIIIILFPTLGLSHFAVECLLMPQPPA